MGPAARPTRELGRVRVGRCRLPRSGVSAWQSRRTPANGHHGGEFAPAKPQDTHEAGDVGVLREACPTSAVIRPIDDGVSGGEYLAVREDRRQYRCKVASRWTSPKNASVCRTRRAQAHPVALMVVSRGSRSAPEPVSRIPGVRAIRETLKSRRVCETRIGLPGRLAPRLPECLIKRPFRETVD
jgi:hypothetical protein